MGIRDSKLASNQTRAQPCLSDSEGFPMTEDELNEWFKRELEIVRRRKSVGDYNVDTADSLAAHQAIAAILAHLLDLERK